MYWLVCSFDLVGIVSPSYSINFNMLHWFWHLQRNAVVNDFFKDIFLFLIFIVVAYAAYCSVAWFMAMRSHRLKKEKKKTVQLILQAARQKRVYINVCTYIFMIHTPWIICYRLGSAPALASFIWPCSVVWNLSGRRQDFKECLRLILITI